MQILRAEGVFVRSYFSPGCHNAEPYRSDTSCLRTPLTVTDRLLKNIMQLPTGPSVTSQNITKIGQLLQSVYHHRKNLRDAITTFEHSESSNPEISNVPTAA